MEKDIKTFYEAPAATVVALSQETVICNPSSQGAKAQDYNYGSLDEN